MSRYEPRWQLTVTINGSCSVRISKSGDASKARNTLSICVLVNRSQATGSTSPCCSKNPSSSGLEIWCSTRLGLNCPTAYSFRQGPLTETATLSMTMFLLRGNYVPAKPINNLL